MLKNGYAASLQLSFMTKVFAISPMGEFLLGIFARILSKLVPRRHKVPW